MNAQTWAAGMLALGGLFLNGTSVRAGDTIRLGRTTRNDAPAVSLGSLSQDVETVDAHYRGGFGGHGHVGRGYVGRGYGYGGYRGYGYGYRGYAYGRSYYYGYRGYGRYYYPGYVYGYAQPYISSNYYCSPPAYYYAPSVYLPISTAASPVTGGPDLLNAPLRAQEALPAPRPVDRTFPYDGDPRLVPMPKADPAPIRTPVPAPQTVPRDGRAVSLPRSTVTPVKLTYPAYGELPRTTAFAEDRVLPVKR